MQSLQLLSAEPQVKKSIANLDIVFLYLSLSLYLFLSLSFFLLSHYICIY